MPKGLFQQFTAAIIADWRDRFPRLSRLPAALSPALPKSSTVAGGAQNRYHRFLFINFQHNSQPWAVGDFTVNVVFSATDAAPTRWVPPTFVLDDSPEGEYRLGFIVHGVDKWWRLGGGEGRYGRLWLPPRDASRDVIITAAIEDVSADVAAMLQSIDQWKSGGPTNSGDCAAVSRAGSRPR